MAYGSRGFYLHFGGFSTQKIFGVILFYFGLRNYPGFVEFYSHCKTNFSQQSGIRASSQQVQGAKEKEIIYILYHTGIYVYRSTIHTFGVLFTVLFITRKVQESGEGNHLRIIPHWYMRIYEVLFTHTVLFTNTVRHYSHVQGTIHRYYSSPEKYQAWRNLLTSDPNGGEHWEYDQVDCI